MSPRLCFWAIGPTHQNCQVRQPDPNPRPMIFVFWNCCDALLTMFWWILLPGMVSDASRVFYSWFIVKTHFRTGFQQSFPHFRRPVVLFGRGTAGFKLDQSTSNFYCCLDHILNQEEITLYVDCGSLRTPKLGRDFFSQPMTGGWHPPIWSARSKVVRNMLNFVHN